ncbi:MAG: hypothetical protein HY816_18305 [Candidatus Wallbacteria bacterium]|nr:hypothetical protein [Candidatus Wallbacteria bacterium]
MNTGPVAANVDLSRTGLLFNGSASGYTVTAVGPATIAADTTQTYSFTVAAGAAAPGPVIVTGHVAATDAASGDDASVTGGSPATGWTAVLAPVLTYLFNQRILSQGIIVSVKFAGDIAPNPPTLEFTGGSVSSTANDTPPTPMAAGANLKSWSYGGSFLGRDGVDDGVFRISIRVADNLGNPVPVRQPSNNTFTVDTTAPLAPTLGLSKSSALLNAGPLTITADFADDIATEPTLEFIPAAVFSLDSTLRANDRQFVFGVTVLPGKTSADGEPYTVTVPRSSVVDRANNVQTAPDATRSGIVDSTGPAITSLVYSEPRRILKLGAFRVTATFSEEITSMVPSVNVAGGTVGGSAVLGVEMTQGGDRSIWSFSGAVVAGDGAGLRTLSITARDSAGNTAGAPPSNTFTVDPFPPRAALQIRAVAIDFPISANFVVGPTMSVPILLQVQNTGFAAASIDGATLTFNGKSDGYVQRPRPGSMLLQVGDIASVPVDVTVTTTAPLGATLIAGSVTATDAAIPAIPVIASSITPASWSVVNRKIPEVRLMGAVAGKFAVALRAEIPRELFEIGEHRYKWSAVDPRDPTLDLDSSFAPNTIHPYPYPAHACPAATTDGFFDGFNTAEPNTVFEPPKGGRYFVVLRAAKADCLFDPSVAYRYSPFAMKQVDIPGTRMTFSRGPAQLHAGPLAVTANSREPFASDVTPTLSFTPAVNFTPPAVTRLDDRTILYETTVGGTTRAEGDTYTATLSNTPDASTLAVPMVVGVVDTVAPETIASFDNGRGSTSSLLKLGFFEIFIRFGEPVSLTPTISISGGTVGGQMIADRALTRRGFPNESLWSLRGDIVAADPNGSRTMTIHARDAAGNAARQPVESTFTVEGKPPTPLLVIKSIEHGRGFFGFVISRSTFPIVRMVVENTGSGTATNVTRDLVFKGPSGVTPYNVFLQSGPTELAAGSVGTFVFEVRPRLDSELGLTQISGDVKYNDPARAGRLVALPTTTFASWFLNGILPPTIAVTGLVPGGLSLSLAGTDHPLNPRNQSRGYEWIQLEPFGPPTAFTPNMVLSPRQLNLGLTTKFSPTRGGKHVVGLRTVGQTQGSEGESPVTTAMVELPLIAGTLPFPDGTIPCGDLTLISRVTDAPPSAVTYSWSSDDGGVLAGVSTDDVTLSVPAANLRPTRTYRFTVLATESPSGITNTATAEIRTEKAVSVIVGGVRRTQYREPLTLTATARLPACVPVSSTAVTLAWSAQTAAGSAVKLPASVATDKASLTIPGGTLSPDTYVFRVDATQVSDASQTASATYRVELFNSKPVPLISPDAMTFGFENSIELNANGSKDPDAGDTLTYGWRFTDTFGLTVTAQLRNGPTSFTSAPVAFGPSSSAARVTLAPNPDPGLYTLELSASDQFLTAPLRTTVLVTEELRVLASPTTEIAPGTAVELSLSGIGSIADSTRTYTWSLADSKGRSVGSFSRNGTADAAATTLFLGDLPAGAYRARVVVQSLRRDRTSELVLQVGNSATVLSGANLSVESPASPFAVIQFSRAELAPAGPREITLDGSRSLVGAGSGSTGLTYSWNLATPVAGALPLFSTAPSLSYKLTKPGDYVFNLDVAQGQSATSRAQAGPFRVTSAPPVPPANARYQVYAKRPEPEFASVPVNAGYVQLDATSSSDPSEEEALTYSWRIVDVPSLTDSTGLSRTVGFADASDGALSLTSTNAKPFVVFDNRRQTESAFAPLIGIGSYRFELTVKKPVAKLASTAFFDVSVQDPSILQPSALIADIAIPPMVVNDDGTTSGPVKGKLKAVEQSSSSLTYRWAVSPAPVSVENGESSEPIFTFDTPGNYQATLIVNDGTYDGRPVTRAFEVKTTDLPPVLIWSVAAGEKRWRVKVDSSRSYTPGTIRPVTHDTRITIKGIFSDLSCLTPRQFWIHGASGPVDDTRTASDAASSLELSFSDNKCHGWQSPVPAEPVEWFVLYHFKATPGTYKAFAQVSNRGGSRTGLYEGTLGATEVGYSLECKTCFGNNPEHVFGPIGPDPSPLVTVFESPPNPKSTARKLSKMGASSSAKNTPEGQLLVTSSSSSSAATGSGIDPGHAASFFSPTSLRVDAPTVVTLKAHLDPLSAPGSPLNFRWQQLEGRSVLLSRLHESGVLESTTAFVPTTSGRLKFQVDADVLRQDPATLQFVSTGDTLTNFVTVLVDSPQSAVPLASATASVTVIPAEGSSTADRRVLLDATGSLIVRGPSDARLTYSWRQVAGADGELQDLGDGKAAFVAPVSGASNEQYYWLELTVTQTPTGEVSEPVYLAITQSALPQRFVQLFSQGVALASTAAAVRNDGTASVADIRVPAGALQGAGLTVETVSAANVRSTPPVVLRTYTLFFHDSGPAEIMLGKQRVVVLNSRLVGGGAATAELLSESPPAAAAENLAGVAGGAGGGCALASSAGGAASSALLMLLPGIWCWLRSQPPHSKRRR